MAIYTTANNKGGSDKTTFALNLIPHLDLDFVVDLDRYQALKNVLSLSDNPIEVRVPTCEQDIYDWAEEGKNVLFDCGGFDSDFNRAALSQSDVIITPSNDDPTAQLGLSHFNETMREVSKMVGEKLTANVVISRVHHARTDFSVMSELVDSLDHLELLPFVIPFSTKIPAAQFEGSHVKTGAIAAKFSLLAKYIKVTR